MADRKPPDDETAIGRVYRDAAHETPSADLDARILAKARASVRPRRAARWAVPLSLAAMIVLSVGVVLRLTQEGALMDRPDTMVSGASAPVEDRTSAPAAPPAANAPESSRERAKVPATESFADRPAPTAAPPARASPQARQSEALAPRADHAARGATADAAPQMLRKEAPAAVTAQSLPTAASADVIGVAVRGRPGAYQFDVTVKSPDTGCDQYADWWEVIGADGKLLYRRVLAHSHVDEQPFTRAGGPVPIGAETEVWVRAHLNTSGYGGMALRGSPARGFTPTPLPASFAAAAADAPPRPDGCAF